MTVPPRDIIPVSGGAKPEPTGGISENAHHRSRGQPVALRVPGGRKSAGQVWDTRNSAVAKQPAAGPDPPVSSPIVDHGLLAGPPIQELRSRGQVYPRCPEPAAVELIQVKVRDAPP